MLALRLMMPFVTAAALVSGVRLLVWATANPLRAVRAGTATLDDLVGAAAGVGAWVVLTWVVIVLVVTALAAVPGVVGRTAGRAGQRITPVTTRRLARMALGLAVATGPVALTGPAVATGPALTGPAVATGPALTGPAVATGRSAMSHAIESAPVAASALDVGQGAGPAEFAELPHIDRPTRPDQVPITVTADQPSGGGDQPSGGVVVPPTRDDEPEDQTITVRRGDTLWAIAAEHLGPDAAPAEIAAEWPRWYEANRQVIGDDPDLILPGTILQNPHQLGDHNP